MSDNDRLKTGDLIFDAERRPLGIVSEVEADEFTVRRRGQFTLKGDMLIQAADGTWEGRRVNLGRGRVVGTKDGWTTVEIGGAE